jgi:hypothetical protein
MPKPKGTPGGNPTPVQTSKFLKRKFPAAKDLPDDVELASKPLCVKLPVKLDKIVRSLPDKSVWLRAAITEKLQKEGLIPGDVQPVIEQAIPSEAITLPARNASAAKT